MRLARRLAAFLVAVGVATLVPATAFAHPLGNFTVNRYAGIVLSPGEVRIDYVVDMAEIPTVQVRPGVDRDADGAISSPEGAAWAERIATELLAGLALSIDGRPVRLDVRSSSVRFSPGQGELDVLRLSVTFAGEASSSGRIAFSDANFEDRVGWREITIAGAPGVAISDPSVPSESITDGLRSYPDDLLSSPLDVREATAEFGPGEGAALGPGSGLGATAGPTGSDDPFAALVGHTGPFMLLALVLAFAFGAFHALGPGHGKTLMAAYLVGGWGRTRHAVAVGGAVAVMHTASVLALGFVVLAATEVFPAERVYPWLGIGSGLVAFGLGAWMLVTRLATWSEGAHAQPHDHPHPHAHEHEHAGAAAFSKRGLAALAAAGGILPSPTALVVLLASVAAHRVGYGLALIAAFSLGLAGALVAIGVVSIRARDAISGRVGGRVGRLIPIASAAAITIVGIVLVGGGATQLS
jgi:ABC-type nickel/cobalt efflux system permease component RcnA